MSLAVVAAFARDAFVWLGIPALVYGTILGLATWILSLRASRAQALTFGLPSIGTVLLLSLSLSLFAAIGVEVAEGRNPNSDTFVGWARLVLVSLYMAPMLLAAVVAHFLSKRPGGGGVKIASVAVMAAFLFVAISAPFSSYVNACHIGNSILVNSQSNCEDLPIPPPVREPPD